MSTDVASNDRHIICADFLLILKNAYLNNTETNFLRMQFEYGITSNQDFIYTHWHLVFTSVQIANLIWQLNSWISKLDSKFR